MALTAFLVGAGTAQEAGPPGRGIEQVWSLDGHWSGVVGDEKTRATYACGWEREQPKCLELGPEGTRLRAFPITSPRIEAPMVRLARLSRGGRLALLVFDVWKPGGLRAYDVNGVPLWSYTTAKAIDDVWATDVTGDGSDEVIVGYNGDGGVHVLDGGGRLLWKSTAVGNVWHVCGGSVGGDGGARVVTTSVGDAVHVFSGDGRRRDVMVGAGLHPFLVRVGQSSERDKPAAILATDFAFTTLTALAADGSREWSMGLPPSEPAASGRPFIASAYVAPGKPWLAVGMHGKQVHVIDIERREVIGSLSEQGRQPEVGWAAGVAAPVLLVATGRSVNAFRLTESR